MKMTVGIRLERLLFAGTNLDDAWVDFEEGLNIIYGGSNAGKSFTLKALDFMFGAERLKLPKQGENYERVYLWMRLSHGAAVTLERATKGGSFKLFDGHISPSAATVMKGITLAPNQKGRRNKRPKHQSLSEYLLQRIGVDNALLAKNEAGEKIQFSVRLLSHYLFVGEDAMIGERSPIQIPDQRMSSLDKSLFRFLLTGLDDSAVVEVPNGEQLAAARDGKIELLTEMFNALDTDLPPNETENELLEQLERVTNSALNIHEMVQQHQQRLDDLSLERRQLLDLKNVKSTKTAELQQMLNRFVELKAVYQSDIERLDALQEGGVLLQMMSAAPCPVCGAEVAHQHNLVGLDAMEQQRIAASAEVLKVSKDLQSLELTIGPLELDITSEESELQALEARVQNVNSEIEQLRPFERALRVIYEDIVVGKGKLANRVTDLRHKKEYQTRIQDLQALKIGRQRAEGLSVSIDSGTGHEFSRTVKAVLEAWHYPDMGEVHFDSKAQDIVVNGRDRIH